MMKGVSAGGRGLEPANDGLARRHAERPAHEIEILHRRRNRQTVELAEADLHRVCETGLVARILETVGIATLVAEFERIGLHFAGRNVFVLAAIEQRLEPGRRADAHVVVRRRNDELVLLDILVEDELAGLRTFDPEVLRRLPPIEEAPDLRPNDVFNPVHDVPGSETV